MNNTMLKLAPEALSSARTIGDLATPESCLVALKIATVQIAARIGLSCHSAIKSSVPVYRAFHLTLQQARAHKAAGLLLMNGLDVPVTYCQGEVDTLAFPWESKRLLTGLARVQN